MPLTELINSLETIAGAHGVGRIDMVENRLVGIKSREIYEAPAAVALHTAHRELEALVVPKDLERLKGDLGRAYADLVYNGLWFAPTREAIDAFVSKVQERVTGTARLKLYRGDCRVVGRKSEYALYDASLATYDEGDAFDHFGGRRIHQNLGASCRDREPSPARGTTHESWRRRITRSERLGSHDRRASPVVRVIRGSSGYRCLRVSVLVWVRPPPLRG